MAIKFKRGRVFVGTFCYEKTYADRRPHQPTPKEHGCIAASFFVPDDCEMTAEEILEAFMQMRGVREVTQDNNCVVFKPFGEIVHPYERDVLLPVFEEGDDDA